MNDLPSEAPGKDDHFRQVTEKIDLVRAVAWAIYKSQCGAAEVTASQFQGIRDLYIKDAEAALADISEAGYAVVPREPTKAMILDGGDEIGSYNLEMDGSYRLAKDAYKAMLAAAERDDG